VAVAYAAGQNKAAEKARLASTRGCILLVLAVMETRASHTAAKTAACEALLGMEVSEPAAPATIVAGRGISLVHDALVPCDQEDEAFDDLDRWGLGLLKVLVHSLDAVAIGENGAGCLAHVRAARDAAGSSHGDCTHTLAATDEAWVTQAGYGGNS